MTETELIREGWKLWDTLSAASLDHAIQCIRRARKDSKWTIDGTVRWVMPKDAGMRPSPAILVAKRSHTRKPTVL